MPWRTIASADGGRGGERERPERRIAVDVEQGHGRRQRQAQHAAGKGDVAAERFVQQLGPARRLERVGLVRPEQPDRVAARLDAREQIGSRARLRIGDDRLGRLDAAALGERLADDLDVEAARPR